MVRGSPPHELGQATTHLAQSMSVPELHGPTTMIEGYKSLWAKSKPRHPLWKHLIDAGAVSLALDIAPPQGWSAKQIALIVGLHDVGKADAAFQHQVAEFSENLKLAGYPVTNDSRCRHERISARFIRNKFMGTGPTIS